MPDWWNPLDWPEIAYDTGSNAWGSITGQDAAERRLREGQQASLDALDRWYQQGRSDLAPFRERDMQARDRYQGLVEGMSFNPQSGAYKQLWADTERDLNTAFAKQGNFGGGAHMDQLRKARTGIQQDQERRFEDWQFRRAGAQAALFNPGASQASAAAAFGMGPQQASIYQQGGILGAQSAMAPFQNALGVLGVAGSMGFRPFGG